MKVVCRYGVVLKTPPTLEQPIESLKTENKIKKQKEISSNS